MTMIIALAALISPPVMTRPGPPPDTTYVGAIRELTRIIPEFMQRLQVPGASIALVDGQRVVWSRGFGHTDLTKRHQVTPETLFSLQSISKTYTAIGVLRAIDKGLLQLDDPLKKFLPAFTVRSRLGSDQADRITIRHLLSHQAGFGHEAPIGGNFDDRPTTFEDHIRSISDSWLLFPVGHHYSYSNLGIDLAGYVMQVISKKPFAAYMKDEVFTPLGMDSSTFDQVRAFRHHSIAKGHERDRIVPDLQIVIVPSGGMYSSVIDMAKFVMFELANGRVGGRQVLSLERLHEMATPQFSLVEQQGGYGLGLGVSQQYGTKMQQHGGGGYGYSTQQTWLPEYQLGVVVLTNSNSGIASSLADTAMRLMIRTKYGAIPPNPPLRLTDRPSVSVNAAALRSLEGTYKPRGGIVRFEVRDGVLHRRTSDTSTVALTARSPTEFTTQAVRFTFDIVADSVPRGVWMLSCCSLEYWSRNDGPQDPPGPARVEWAGLQGRYRTRIYGGELFTDVSVRNGYLYLSWSGGLKLTEHSPGLFFVAGDEAVQLEPRRLVIGNRPFVKVDP